MIVIKFLHGILLVSDKVEGLNGVVAFTVNS